MNQKILFYCRTFSIVSLTLFLTTATYADNSKPSIQLLNPVNGAWILLRHIDTVFVDNNEIDHSYYRTHEFKWKYNNVKPENKICAEFITDKGKNPFDDEVEETIQVDVRTNLIHRFHEGRYLFSKTGESNPKVTMPLVSWGVRATICKNSSDSCPCEGKTIESGIRHFYDWFIVQTNFLFC